MTQTLAKVSKIAGTEFHLLDLAEERNLISDIEHLLVTEFPDQELRRDTRVSFAARMLSNLVPQLTINSEHVYNLESEKISLEYDLKTLVEKGKDTKTIKEQISKINTSLAKEIQLIEREENLIIQRTLRLLLKAIRDNHDKVRLWTRVLEFSLKTGKVSISVILNEIASLKNKGEINSLSAGFINALTLQVLSQLLFKALNSITSEQISSKQKLKYISFIKMVITKEVLDYYEASHKSSTKFYEINSHILFKYSIGTILYLINDQLNIDEKLITDYNLINWKKYSPNFINSTHYSIGAWAWWTFNRITINNNKYLDLKLWKIIENKLDPSQSIDKNVILLFPRNLSKTTLNKINNYKEAFIKKEGWLFEVRMGLTDSNSNVNNYSFLKNIISKTDYKYKKEITLYDWITWSKSQSTELKLNNSQSLTFDPRLGEWMALEIIKRVANKINEKINNLPFEEILSKAPDYSICFHPNNFKLPRKWIKEEKFTWEELRIMLNQDHSSITLRSKNDLIFDDRFDFTEGLSEGLYKDNHEDTKTIYAIASLLICLLTKKYNLPYRWNPMGHQQVWLGLAKSALRDVALSTYTRDIIDGCFSNRNFETIILSQLQAKKGMNLINDTSSDPPSIRDLKTFIKYVELAQKKLESQQLSVTNHQPRQLVPISLKQMKRNSYQEQIENNNELQ